MIKLKINKTFTKKSRKKLKIKKIKIKLKKTIFIKLELIYKIKTNISQELK
jgi:hypothetical protein